MALVADQPRAAPAAQPDPLISRVPYLPGLDGLRAIAVVAVMIYHANSDWLPGGYLGVEMFFVISGYLITLLLIAEQERSYRVSLRQFWLRRARRLLPALGVLLVGVTIWTALFEREALGALRGDVIAGVFYVSNWYQLWVGLGYTAAGDFAPLRHLWSLAVEEQFYLLWPLVMLVLLRRRGSRSIASTSRWLVVVAVGIAVLTALAYHPGPIGEPEETPEAYWNVFGHAISKLDFLYIGSFSRASGILLGAALAMVWRPYALRRSRIAAVGGRFDLLAVVGLAGFLWMCVNVPLITDDGAANGTLFRGGLLVSSVLTLFLIAAVAHPSARANMVLDRNLLRWIGTRSYGLYLYHWPVYQAIRGVAGNKLDLTQFVLAMAITVVIAEASYRFIETPIRQRRFRATWRHLLGRSDVLRRGLALCGAVLLALSVFAVTTLATADVEANEIEQSFVAADDDVVDLAALAEERSVGDEPATPVVPPVTTVAVTAAPTTAPTTTVAATTPPTTAAVTSAAPVTTVAGATESTTPTDDTTPAPTTAPETTAPPTTPPPTTVPPTTVPVVPATTEPPPPPEPDPAPEPEVGPRSRGVVTDLTGVAPLGIDPVATPGALPVLALGDSVMRGAAEELTARGVAVDAVVSRQFTAFLPEVQAARDAGLIGSVVIVHLGTNGSFPQSSADQMMGILADVPVVVFVTGKADRGWINPNNAIIRALPERYPNVTVLDWEVLAAPCGDCFYADRIHLDPSGQQFYTDLLGQLVGF